MKKKRFFIFLAATSVPSVVYALSCRRKEGKCI